MFDLIWTSHFKRGASKFAKRHPEHRRRLATALRDLEADPTNPRLRLHPLGGPLEGLHAVRIDYGYRITLQLDLNAREITLLDIGSHDDLYR